MKLLNDIQSKHIIALDIETVRIKKDYDELSPQYKSAWQYKNKNEGVIPSEEELIKRWDTTASLYAEFSKVCAVSLSFLDTNGEKLMCKSFFGEDEALILSELKDFLQRIESSKDGKHYRLVGHAAKYFDYPFLCKRYVINDLDIPTILDTAHLKPWETRNLCTNQDIWKMGGMGLGSSLPALCVAMGIPASKDDIEGDEVGECYYKGEFKRIAEYCNRDAIATFNIIRKVKREPIFQFSEVEYIDVAPATLKPAHVLEQLYNANEITDEIAGQLLDVFKKVTPEDKEKVVEIVLGAFTQNDFETPGKYADSAKVIAHKKGQIERLLNKL